MQKKRWELLEFLGIIGESSTTYYALGTGVTKLNDSPGPKVEEKTYISNTNASAEVVSYKNTFPVDFDKIKDDTAIAALEAIGDDQLTGDDAKFELVRVDLNDPHISIEGSYRARQYIVCYEAGDSGGAGGEGMTGGGVFHQIGDLVKGYFVVSTKVFTPDE